MPVCVCLGLVNLTDTLAAVCHSVLSEAEIPLQFCTKYKQYLKKTSTKQNSIFPLSAVM